MLNYLNDIVLFKIYLTIAISFIVFISIIITIEALKIIYTLRVILFVYYLELNNQVHKVYTLNMYRLNIAFQSQCMWLLSISLLEYNLNISVDNANSNMYNIGLCYMKLSLFHLAEYYFSKVKNNSSYYLKALKQLSVIYTNLNQKNNLIKTYNKILYIEPSNTILKQRLSDLL